MNPTEAPVHSLADRERNAEPLLYEQIALAMEAAFALKLALEDDGISQTELARRVGKSRAVIARQLAGNENLTLGTLAALAHAIGRKVSLRLDALPSCDAPTQNKRAQVVEIKRGEEHNEKKS